jgi:hypothetical protein
VDIVGAGATLSQMKNRRCVQKNAGWIVRGFDVNVSVEVCRSSDF